MKQEFSYPVIEAATIAEFTSAYRKIEQRGDIDSEGASEWRGTVSEWLCRRLGVETTKENVTFIRSVIAHGQFDCP